MKSTVVGMDPSLTGFGYCDAIGPERFATAAGGELDNRCSQICSEILHRARRLEELYPDHGTLWIIEAPMLRTHRPKRGAEKAVGPPGSHLWEMGWLYCRLSILSRILGHSRPHFRVLFPDTRTIRKATLGNGGAKTKLLPELAYARWGVKFERDSGRDKLMAWLCKKYGELVLSGKIIHTPAAPRGQGVTARAAVRKRTKNSPLEQ